MGKFWYGQGALRVANNDVDLVTADLRALLVMTGTTADTELDKLTVSTFTTLDEFDGPGYTAGGVALTVKSAIYTTVPARRVEMDADNVDFGTLFPGSRDIQGYLVYDAGTDAPLLFDDTPSSLPASPIPGGENVTLVFSASGWTYIQSNPLV